MLVGLLLLGILSPLQAQSRRITGTVVDEEGEPLAGVNIVVKKTTIGTVSNLDGQFALDVPEPYQTLQIIYIGYQTQEISPGSGRVLHIVMKDDTWWDGGPHFPERGIRLNKEYRHQLSSRSAPSLSDLTLTRKIAADAMQSAELLPAGVRVVPVAGEAPQAFGTLVRGLHSFASSGPLYVVDGVPMPADPTGTMLSFLNPMDISEMYVLRDVSETAFYGAEGASGVVLIHTRDGDFRWNTPHIQLTARGGYTPRPSGQGTRNAFAQQYTATLTSGIGSPRKYVKTPQLYASLDYMNSPSVVRGQGTERYSMRLNMDRQPTRLAAYGFGASASHLEINNSKGWQLYAAPYLRLEFSEDVQLTTRASVAHNRYIREFLLPFLPEKQTTWTVSNLLHTKGTIGRSWKTYSFTAGQESRRNYGHTQHSLPVHVHVYDRWGELSLNYRLDNISHIQGDNWGSFASVGLTHRVMEWFRGRSKYYRKLPYLNLRASYGTVGNLSPWLGQSWERTGQLNVGIDLGGDLRRWGKNPNATPWVMNLSVDYYHHLTRKLLLPERETTLSAPHWKSQEDSRLRNQGVEIALQVSKSVRQDTWMMKITATHPTAKLTTAREVAWTDLLMPIPWIGYYDNPNWYGSVLNTYGQGRWKARLQCNYTLGGRSLLDTDAYAPVNGGYRKRNSFSIHSARFSYELSRYTGSKTLFVEVDDVHLLGRKQEYYPGYIHAGRSLTAGISWRL